MNLYIVSEADAILRQQRNRSQYVCRLIIEAERTARNARVTLQGFESITWETAIRLLPEIEDAAVSTIMQFLSQLLRSRAEAAEQRGVKTVEWDRLCTAIEGDVDVALALQNLAVHQRRCGSTRS